jgi:ABC-type amino acid transport substrate-binding protein
MRRTTWKRIFALLALMTLVLAACAQDDPSVDTDEPEAVPSFAPDSYMAEIVKKGKITIGVKFDVPQFGFLNPATSKPEGFDIDLGNLIAEKLGVEAEFVEAISANRIPFLNEDKVDLIISTMTINEERKGQIDFSIVYYVAHQRFLVAKGSPIKSIEDVESRKASVCSAKGSTSEKNLRAAAPSANVILQDGYSQCFQLLQNKQADAVTTDDVILVGLLKNDPANFAIVGGEGFSTEPYGMGIKKGRQGFKEFVDGVIKEAKEDGTWEEFYEKWVEAVTDESSSPPPDDVAAKAPSPKAT